MLTLFDSGNRSPRREMLRIGAGAFAGAFGALNGFGNRVLAQSKGLPISDRSVILLFLHGGPTQIETFDPKMGAPEGVRSVTGEVATSIPGVTFGSSFPLLAERAERLAIVRSFVPGNGNHDIKPVMCKETGGANVGSLYAKVAGANRPKTGMPTNAMLFPQSVDGSTGPAINDFGNFQSVGSLGSGTAPFVPARAAICRRISSYGSALTTLVNGEHSCRKLIGSDSCWRS